MAQRKTKLVTIESYGKIEALGGILGPITSPMYIELDVIIGLINAGKAVYEVNPSNTKEKTRLNRLNLFRNNFTMSDNKNDKIESVKASDVGVMKSKVEPSSVSTTIVAETGESMIGTDIFVSNKYS